MKRTAAIARVDLAKPLETLRVEARYDEVLLVVSLAGHMLGQTFVRARPEILPEEQWCAIAAALGDAVMSEAVRQRVALARPASPHTEPPVAVIVCTRERPEQLAKCLASIADVRTPPAEVIVVDNTDGDQATAEVCRRHGARHVVEPVPGQTRARNRGLLETDAELVAFTDDDCVVDQHWLDGLAEAFSDPSVMCVTGYIGPLELETPAQYLFERHGGFERHARHDVYDIKRRSPLRSAAIAGAGANMIYRRAVFAQVGNFAEYLGPGTPARSSDDKYHFYLVLAAGFRIAYEPQRVVWHRHRREDDALARILGDYTTAEFAYTTWCLLRHREPSVLRVWAWWIRRIAADVARGLVPGKGPLPLSVALGELRGALAGPRALQASLASRRAIAPLPAPAHGKRPEPRPVARVSDELPQITVALATFNRREQLRHALAALAHQDLGHDRFEVVLVVDGSTDGTAEMARGTEVPYSLRIIEQPNRGLAASRNRGADEARHPLIVFLDDDIRLEPEALRAHASAHAAAPQQRFGMGYYPPVLAGSSLWATWLRLWWEDHFRRKAEPGHRWAFADITDGNSSIPADLFKELGAFDERFTGGRRQDFEFGIRLLGADVPVEFIPDAVGRHHLDPSLAGALRNARAEGRYDVLLASIHPDARQRLPLAAHVNRPDAGRTASLVRSALRTVPPPTVPVVLKAFERTRQRRLWKTTLDEAFMRAYMAGVLEACGGRPALDRLAADLRAHAPLQGDGIDLATPRSALPADVDGTNLPLSLGGRPVASIEPSRPGQQWDWDALLEQVEDEVSGPLAMRLVIDSLYPDRSA